MVPVLTGTLVPVWRRPLRSPTTDFVRIIPAVRNRYAQTFQIRRPDKEIGISLPQPALFDDNQPAAFQFLDIVPRLPFGDAEAGSQSFHRGIAARVFAGKAQQANVTELRTAADPSMFEKPVRREGSLKDPVRVERCSDVHRIRS